MHALLARRYGLDVVHLEREAAPRGASVRNFGLVWVSGRADGAELALARRAREWWGRIGAEVPGVGFRPRGSITVARTTAELAVCAQMAESPGAAARGFALVDPAGIRALNPALRGGVLGGLHATLDASVEPGQVLGAVRESLIKSAAGGSGYTWLPGRTAVDVND